MFVEDILADRLTGELTKMAHVVELDIDDARLAENGAIYNGLVDLSGAAPVVGDDAASVQAGRDLFLDVLANDADPDGQQIRVDGLTDAKYGEVFLQEDGTVLYRPYLGFTGEDSFEYWATDGTGKYSKAVATIDVWE